LRKAYNVGEISGFKKGPKVDQKKYPAIQGLRWHRDQYYSFFLPIDWHPFSWADHRQGMIFGPDPADPMTVFAVSIQDLGTTITTEDLDVLYEAFLENIGLLPGCVIERHSHKIAGKMLELEAQYTFQQAGETCKCWCRMFYFQTRQITMTAQGATLEKYTYWLPIFYEAMMTAGIHTAKPGFEYLSGLGN
jgi:hypothetical protein